MVFWVKYEKQIILAGLIYFVAMSAMYAFVEKISLTVFFSAGSLMMAMLYLEGSRKKTKPRGV